MSIEKTHETTSDETNKLGYKLFRENSVRRFNPSVFTVKREDSKGWYIVELKEGKWTCDCNTATGNNQCSHIYSVLLASAIARTKSEESYESAEEKTLKCRYCGTPDISRVGFRYNARGISRRYLCNTCLRKFSVPYIEPHSTLGLPSGTLWILSQVAMLTSKLNDLLRELDAKITFNKESCLDSNTK